MFVSSYPEHENVVKFIGICQDLHWLYLVMEWMDGGELLSYLRNSPSPLDKSKLTNFCLQATLGVQHLHSHDIIHRDLSARNCMVICSVFLIMSNFVLKVSDFGHARTSQYFKENLSNLPQPLKWSAIESLEKKSFSFSSDTWGLGVLMWEIFSHGKCPYSEFKDDDIYGVLKYLNSGQRLPQPSDCTDQQLWNLIFGCWSTEPTSR